MAIDKNTKVLEDCIKQIDKAGSYWDKNKRKYRNNLDFVLGYQDENRGASWQGRERNTRLNFNVLHSFVKSIMGEQLQNTPDVVVMPASKNVEQWEVDLNEGILRGIFYDSNLPQKTYKVFFNQLAGGYGAYRVHPEYESGMSFEQVIKISQEEDPTLCYWDYDAEDDNKVLGRFCGRHVAMPKEDFEKDYPDIKSPSGFSWDVMGASGSFYTKPSDYIVIAEHWVKEEKMTTVYLLKSGETCTKAEYGPLVEKIQQEYTQQLYLSSLNGQPEPPEPQYPEIIAEKRDKVSKIKYYKLLRNQIIEEKDWPGTVLPLVYVDGDSSFRHGQQEIKSFCQFAHDSQRALNYTKNQIIQQIKNFRREQWIGTPENMQGQGIKQMWQNPEEQAGILLAKRDKNGQLPTKVAPSQISPDLLNMQQFLGGDIQNILGRHDASQGQPGNEVSGAALLHRIVQDNMGSYLQLNNLCTGIVTVAFVALDMLPAIYDTERDVITRDKKGEPMVSTINEFVGLQQNNNGQYEAEQAYYKNQISRKKMRVELSAGPMFSAQKQIEYMKLTQFAGLLPQEFVPAMADMIAENIDLPNTNQLVKRVKAFVPKPVLMQAGEMSPEEMQQFQQEQQQQQQQPPPPQVQAQMQKNEIEDKKIQLQEKDLEQRARDDEVKNYLSGLKNQIELERVQATKQGDQISLEKDIVKANAEMQSAALNAMHEIHKSNTALAAPTRQGHGGSNGHYR